ncbi:hypothetical protein A3H89_05390 [Candidatus Amesbacteria bacterium RIFCSPLOWO2_02_FULL_48_11]|uniref:Uncharacterized protein n=3 Tax=Candidatus Amesiibacteriota TaxID=1752730 RepID=A0A1F4ZXA0_9BACT|nr:MAG: hypothetical protein UX78_C0002G0014 [Candidatus Amesbacteria bacterium GW2011_GWA2_47_11]KKU98866.1 MAG: hypothetical protein UY33_C0043G0010 [Candidatus Amesbacteria bacterium GW2011_GWA1_48_9]OGD01605.1 MAG: hypothetical protein A2354_04265 [Candidatus Amesbacteria bacterium RIFOXYB1_FULL_47_12]OGD06651.1 MAG: hypothetical protein A3H89_05390 [Candidatus Amesbacteria bacterium RIFCSPLOWO2_02_FULL_48_11]OGD10985.1 MAG: hypothetical protein A2576_02280 [Candidatus Amesbacteria bacteriu
MTTSQFLSQLVKDTNKYSLTESDNKTIQREGIKKFIFYRLNSTKYRAQATSEDYLQKVIDKISLSVDCREPLHITLPFGATKNPYLPTAPGIDWAEVFNIAYIREYLAPIAAAYEHGVLLDYISVAAFEERVNNIPQRDINKYDHQFTQLINLFQKYLPNNMQLSYSRVSDKIPQKELIRRINIIVTRLRKSWNNQPKEVRDRKLFRAQRNCLYDPKAKNIETILLKSALGHDAFCSESWTTKAAPWDEKDMIALGHSYTTGWAIHVRSSRGSSVNFWSGVGILAKRAGEYIPTVYSPRQLETIKHRLKQETAGIFTKSISKLSQIPILYE